MSHQFTQEVEGLGVRVFVHWFVLNHFIEAWLTNKKLRVINLYNWISLEISIHL